MRASVMSILTAHPHPHFHSVWIENLSASACVCCQTGLCGSGLLFCKIPNLISIFASSCFANPAFFCRIYLIWLSACNGVLSNQPGSEWTSKLKPWPRCVVAAAESDFPFTICCREEEGGEEEKKTANDTGNFCSYLALRSSDVH